MSKNHLRRSASEIEVCAVGFCCHDVMSRLYGRYFEVHSNHNCVYYTNFKMSHTKAEYIGVQINRVFISKIKVL